MDSKMGGGALLLFCIVLAAAAARPTDKGQPSTAHSMIRMLMYLKSSDDTENFIQHCLSGTICRKNVILGSEAIVKWKSEEIKKAFSIKFYKTYQCFAARKPALCPVDGDWTSWSVWSPCNSTCGGGYRSRTRTCTNPEPSNGGIPCSGVARYLAYCNNQCHDSKDGASSIAEAHSRLTEFHSKHPLLVTACMEHHCNYPELLQVLSARDTDTYWSALFCYKYRKACPVDGGWSAWSNRTTCSSNCGVGYEVRHRTCTDPRPSFQGAYCAGEPYEKTDCLAHKECPENHPPVTEWSEWSECSVKCGTYGVQGSSRSCLRQKVCAGEVEAAKMERVRPCQASECPVEGGWSEWSKWTNCSAGCGDGRRTRLRLCNHPFPSGGKTCPGEQLEISACNVPAARCRDITGGSSASRKKRQFPPEETDNSATQTVRTGGVPLPPDPVATSQPPQTQRPTEPAKTARPTDPDLPPPGPTAPAEKAPDLPPPPPTEPPGTTEPAKTARPTDPDLPPPPTEPPGTTEPAAETVAPLIVPLNDTICNVQRSDVPVIGDVFGKPLNADMESRYKPWGCWSRCSETCNGGARFRQRQCKNKAGQCEGEVKQVQFCNVKPCPVNGEWSTWLKWQPCSVTCGEGVQTRYRKCDLKVPKHGGTCPGLASESKACTVDTACPPAAASSWGTWSQWSTCDASCSGGTSERSRTCTGGSSKENCPGVSKEYKPCNNHECTVNGNWAQWTSWTTCSATCGLGARVRDRSCTDPSPQGVSGSLCVGPGTELQNCISSPCQARDAFSANFQGTSHLEYHSMKSPSKVLHLYIQFLPKSLDGVLVHRYATDCVEDAERCDDHVILQLKNGYVDVTASMGEAKLSMVDKELIATDAWHTVLLSIVDDGATMVVDDRAETISALFSMGLPINGDFDQHMMVGMMDPQRKEQGDATRGFTGHISNLRVNFKTLALKRVEGWFGFGAPVAVQEVLYQPADAEAIFPEFRGNSFTWFPVAGFNRSGLAIQVVIKPKVLSGVLLFSQGKAAGSYVYLALDSNKLKLCVHQQEEKQCALSSEITESEWYHVQIRIETKNDITEGEMRINNGPASQLSTAGSSFIPRRRLYVGGGSAEVWTILSMATGKNEGYRGLIYAIKVGLHRYSFKQAALHNTDGMVNSVGASIAARYTDMFENQDSEVYLRCDYSRFVTKDSEVEVQWLKGRTILRLDEFKHGTEEAGLSSKHVKELRLDPKGWKLNEGVYACHIHIDGTYINTNAWGLSYHLTEIKGGPLQLLVKAEDDLTIVAVLGIFSVLFLIILLVVLKVFGKPIAESLRMWLKLSKIHKEAEQHAVEASVELWKHELEKTGELGKQDQPIKQQEQIPMDEEDRGFSDGELMPPQEVSAPVSKGRLALPHEELKEEPPMYELPPLDDGDLDEPYPYDDYAHDSYAPDDLPPENYAPDEFAPENYASGDLATENYAPENYTHEDYVPENYATLDFTAEDFAPEDLPPEMEMYTTAEDDMFDDHEDDNLPPPPARPYEEGAYGSEEEDF